ncbi:MAG: pyridoxamine 5'-phosphate oxidase family protein [[Eubacterium] siraeum]
MRRKDREITDKNEIMDIIDRSKVIRIAFTGEEYPYVLPFNFGWHEEKGRQGARFILTHCHRRQKEPTFRREQQSRF